MLEARGLEVRYGAVHAVHALDLVLGRGEIVTLIGANGAGKSSVINALAGLVPAPAAAIVLEGVAIGALDVPARVRRGISVVVEGRGVFAELTVRENLELGTYARADLRSKTARAAGIDRAVALFPRLGERMTQAAGTLSGGEQQMLAIARALMIEPRVLLLDEPSLGLAPRIVDEISDRLRGLASTGAVSILVAEQNAALGLDLASRAYVLKNGRLVLEGACSVLREDRDLIGLYLGDARPAARVAA